jgi:hypothetical protein
LEDEITRQGQGEKEKIYWFRAKQASAYQCDKILRVWYLVNNEILKLLLNTYWNLEN